MSAAAGVTERPTKVKSKIYRLVFWPLWFVVIPLALAAITVSLLGAGDNALPEGAWGRLRYFVQDQKVPAIIVFFTLYEMFFYQFRYSIPLAERLGMAGRSGLPKNRRREYEHAGQLLDEVARVQRKHPKELNQKLPADERARLDSAMQQLAEVMARPTFDLEAFDSAYEEALNQSSKLAPWQRGEVREYTESILIAVGVALLLRAFLFEAFKIPSGSMLPTLQINDHIFVNKFTYGPTIPFTKNRILSDLPPERGDIVVFEYPDPNTDNARQDFIKRVIALPGDILEAEGGHPIINGWRVPSCLVGTYTSADDFGYEKTGELFIEFLGDESYLTLYEQSRADGRQGPYRVAENEFWVMGDNRNNSQDSRLWRNGRGAGVPYENVKGRALFVWLSFNNQGNDALGVTWDRLFTNVMGHPRLPKEAPASLKAGIERCLAHPPSSTDPPKPEAAQLQAGR